MPDEPWVGLAEAISGIRSQLQQAMREGEGEELRFTSGPVEIELAVNVDRDASGKVKLTVLPWSVEAGGSAASGTTSRISCTLHPVDGSGSDARISEGIERRPL
ncbi:trypco2 family protein [Nocardiopsis chromatogenes]|uniref:trypco2 family protein n=1 Tax=Nocardiopsis chromatogenes TaxID=280239 RepID=UPI00034AB497|nr:trypco2 family protein [Nocardiopsis chromatogenes]